MSSNGYQTLVCEEGNNTMTATLELTFASSALKFETVEMPTKPFALINFNEPNSTSLCKRMSDMDEGGYSTVNLDFVPDSKDDPPHARFHGTISTELPPDRLDILATGYAGWRTLDRPPTIFGRSLWDIDPYAYLALRVKSDGRKYFVNIQTDSIIPTDLHQHRLYAKRPGEWETILINFNSFVRTNHGIRVEPQSELLRQRIKSVGISLIDRIPKPYDLCIGRIWATNGQGDPTLRQDELPEDLVAKAEKGELNLVENVKKRNKEPEKILI